FRPSLGFYDGTPNFFVISVSARYQRIQVNNLIVALEGIMPVQQNMMLGEIRGRASMPLVLSS
ncbi:hypothetical protein, partial [Klebsiella variicola]